MTYVLTLLAVPLLDYVPADWWEKKKLREKNLASYAIPPNTLNSGGRGLFLNPVSVGF